ncbi:cysteine dioxygenase [Streptomyces hoynatensis]|uniref:Cysteine dioxygenase n=1 Tax=Streptomyces hoynatensis TaxID=1141874 RepID=A0A3A9YQN7_9ACTN|nr:cysteine dioxygenase family protein [Streptomyces hoynatensis]RKN38312.1 cysteine dioxygenase [Streptomyces hoynatensis]
MSLPSPSLVTPRQLAATVRRFAARPELWRPQARFTSPERWYQRLEVTEDHEVWLLTWLPGQGTEIHDHGDASGSFGVVEGTLTERSFGSGGARERSLGPGGLRAFGPDYVHQVVNDQTAPAISIHAYSPVLTRQSYYAQTADGGLRLLRTDAVED